ncbi:MAG: YwiC-like family protein [Gammaproteobacteria bacterium]|nr:YwiC-like family protein [Gammaproteobacteria bacterium]
MSQKNKKNLSARGWVPNYHGGWAMISVPVILGIAHVGFHWIHLLLLILWWVGYFCFYAVTIWLRSGRKASFYPPVKTYSLALLLPALILVLCAPYVVWWGLLVVPIFAITIWETVHRRERSFLNDSATIIVACLLLPVSYDLGTTQVCFEILGDNGLWGTGLMAQYTCDMSIDTNWRSVWFITSLVCAYFIGTVFYVKTNIRDRRSDYYLIASVLFHVVCTAYAFYLAETTTISVIHAYIWVFLTIRSLAVPLYGRNRHWLSAKKIGIGEVIGSLLVFVTLL